MEKFDKFKNLMKLGSTSLVVLVVSLIYYIVWVIFYNPFMVYSPLYNNGLILLVLVYGFIYVLFCNVYNGFKIGHLRITDIIYSQVTAIALVNMITYVDVSLMDRRLLDPLMFFVMTIFQFLIIFSLAFISNRLYFIVYKPLNILLLYENDYPDSFVKKVNLRNDKFDIRNCKTVHKFDVDVKKMILQHETIMLHDITSNLRNEILKFCYENQIPAYITPKISDIIVGSSEWIHLFDTPLFLSKNTNISFEQSLLKRFLDLSLSSILLLVSSPIFLIISIIIKLSDNGCVFYHQERLTIHNRIFKILKFRSMIMNAESKNSPQLARKNDDRITPIGRFIRKTRIDELPQLINIFKGDMSFVGPRPERPELVDKYLIDFPEFAYRTRVKAGLTGYAQIMGKYNTSIYDKLKLDLMYIENFSLLLDLKILLATIKYVITPANEESSEGFDE